MGFSVPQLSFTGGEWAPSLHARTDLEKYPSAVKLMRNFYCHAHGGASNRPGLRFVGEVKDSPTRTARLIPFQFSTVQSYMLEFGNLCMRVFKDGARVTETDKVITGVSQANPGVVTSAAHGYSAGDWVYIAGIVGMTRLNGRVFKVGTTTTDTFQLKDVDGNNINTSALTAYSSGGTVARIYTLTTTYAEADLALLKVVQNADTMRLTHPSYVPRIITRTGHASWTITDITFAPSIAAPANFARDSGSGTGSTYAVTAVKENGEESLISSTATGGANDVFGWDAVADADHYNFYEEKNGVFGWLGSAGLSGGSPSFEVPTSTDADMAEAPPTAKTPFGSAGNYPGVSTFFQQRWVPARTNNKPQTLWGTVTGSFNNMSVRSPIHEDDSYEFTIDSRQVNEIRWMVPLDVLIVGTSGSEWRLAAGRQGDAVSPTSVDMKQQSEWGVSHIQPIVIGNTILFIDGSEKQIRDLLYSLEVDGYTGNDLTILANHLFERNTLERWCYQKGTDSIIWAVRDDGTLLGMTYHREHKVWGWHRHDTDGFFEDIASVINASGRSDVYAIVRRTINGTTRRYIEMFADRYFDDVRDAFFVDSGLSLDVPITITGISKAAECVITAPSHGLSNGDQADISDVVGMIEVNLKSYIVSDVTTHTFKIKDLESEGYIDSTDFTTYVRNGYARKAVTEVPGLDHLEGETIVLFANGNVVEDKVVADGKITLTSAASRIHGGLGYVQDIETLDFNYYPTQEGTAQDRLRYVSRVLLKLKDTRALLVGPPLLKDDNGILLPDDEQDRLQELKFRDLEGWLDPISLFTGDYPVPMEQGTDFRKASVFLRNPYPVPVTILAIIPQVVHGES